MMSGESASRAAVWRVHRAASSELISGSGAAATAELCRRLTRLRLLSRSTLVVPPVSLTDRAYVPLPNDGHGSRNATRVAGTRVNFSLSTFATFEQALPSYGAVVQ
jgi:hypothetical protein